MNDSHSSLFANICKENSWKVLGNLSEDSASDRLEVIDYDSLEEARAACTESFTDDDFNDYISQIFTIFARAELTIIDHNSDTTILANKLLRDYLTDVHYNGFTIWDDWRDDHTFLNVVPCDSESDSDSDSESDCESDSESDN